MVYLITTYDLGIRSERYLMRAAIYARYSSENQRASSIDDQVRLCRQEAERRGVELLAAPTKEALEALRQGRAHTNAILHLTC